MSYRFMVTREDWEPHPERSDYNPKALPERTIREARVFEFGPVTFPADAGADVAVRSLSDQMRPPTPTSPVAPSADAEPPVAHLVSERRDEPAVTIAAKEHTVEYVTREDKASRVSELEEVIARRATAYPGVLPDEEQAADDRDNEERDTLVRDIAAWDARQARVLSFAKDPAKTERTYEPPVVNQINRKPEREIYSFENRYGSV